MALTATWPIVGQWAMVHFDAATYTFLSLSTGIVTLLPFLLRKGRLARILSPELRGPLFVMGLFGSGLSSLLFLFGVRFTTAGNAAIVCQVEVVYSAALAAWILRERLSAAQGLASALVLAGTGLILGRDLGSPHWKGDLIFLFTPWMFQVSHIVSKRLPKDVDYVMIAGARMLYGALTVLPAALWLWGNGQGRAEFSAGAFGLLGFQAVFLGSLNLTLWYVAIRNLELAKTTAVMLSYPALTLVYAWALGQEPVGATQLAGLALSMSGALWLTFQMRGGLPAGEVAPA